MEIYEGPNDIFGVAIYNALNTKIEEDAEYRKFLEKLDLNLVIELDYYPFMIQFKKGRFEVTRNIQDPDVTVKMKTQDFLDILDGKASIFSTFLKGKMGFKPIYKLFTKLLTVYKIFSNMIK
ncbi:MAG: SCP2 sterol-binding domain-containing protein [Candidatus Helarchaeota archaeon]